MKKKVEKLLAALNAKYLETKGKRDFDGSERRNAFYRNLHKVYLDERLTMGEIADHFKCSIGSVCKGFKKTGVEAGSCGERVSGIPYRRTWNIRDDAFDRISTDVGAYWLGFLWSDG